MSVGRARISRKWPDFLLYEEGGGRVIEFDCPSLLEPPQVTVPAGARWAEQMPPWAHDQREPIVERLRAAGAVVREVDGDITRIRSPDGTFRIDCVYQYDERAPAWEWTRIVGIPGERVLAHLPLHKVDGAVQFPRRGVAVLPLRSRFGEQAQLRVNVSAGTFVLHPNEQEQPLDQLESQFPYPPAPIPARSRDPVYQRPQVANLLHALIALLFVPAGLWMSLSGVTTKDRLIGAGGLVFFGGGAVFLFAQIQRAWRRTAPYVPLLALAAQLPWAALVFAGVLFVIGDAPATATTAKENVLLVAAVMPAIAGSVWGFVAVAVGQGRRPIATIALLLGLFGCAAIVGGAVWAMTSRQG